MTAQGQDLVPFSGADYSSLTSAMSSSKLPTSVEVKRKARKLLSPIRIRWFQDAAYGFLRDFNAEDIVCVNLFPTSVDIWQTSEPIRQLVASNLEANRSVSVRFSYTITRNPPNQDDSEDIAAVVTANRTVTIESNEVETRKILREILNGTNSGEVNK